MSNRRRVKPSADQEHEAPSGTVGTRKFLRSIAGIPLPNGCPDCAGTQTVREDSRGEWRVKVVHHDTCPVLHGVMDQ
jgi:hypothetical protein